MRPLFRHPTTRRLGALGAVAPLVVGAGVLIGTAPALAQTTGTYTGRACAAQLTGVQLAVVSIPNQCLGDSGALPPGGGTVNGPTGPISVPGLLTANVLVSQANGANLISSAQSKVAGVTIVPGAAGVTPDLVDVTLLSAATSVNCTGIQSPTNTVVAAVTVQGTPVSITNQPNQTVTVGPVSLILNQQLYNPAANMATGNALVINLNLPGVVTGTITLGHAESDLTQCVEAATTAPAPAAPALPQTGSAAPVAQTVADPPSSSFTPLFAAVPAAFVIALLAAVVISRRAALHGLPGPRH